MVANTPTQLGSLLCVSLHVPAVRVQRTADDIFFGTTVPVQILNFAIIPAHLRIVAVQIVSLGWK
jgi:hypothetical protein